MLRALLLAGALIFAALPANAGEEIVFRFTEEQARRACEAKGEKSFEIITSESGPYTLMCLDYEHWYLLRKIILEDGTPQWNPVVKETPEAGEKK